MTPSPTPALRASVPLRSVRISIPFMEKADSPRSASSADDSSARFVRSTAWFQRIDKSQCNRELPCSDCTKHSRHCEYDKVIRPKVTRQCVNAQCIEGHGLMGRQLDEAEEKIAKLQSLLDQRSLGVSPVDTIRPSPSNKRKSPSRTPTPDASASALLSLSASYDMPVAPAITTTQYSSAQPQLFTGMSPHYASPPRSPRRPVKQMRHWSSSASVQRPLVPPVETSMPDKQPKNASGYEWNEREGGAGDGTGSLSIEPDGNGYLGN